VGVLRLVDWRTTRFLQGAFSSSQYDPLVGWVTKAGLVQEGFNTIDHGIRKNRVADSSARPGGILVVGDSFTAGSEVSDEETWPAQLEGMVQTPVLNAGVGGWGVDQMVLRAEHLRTVKPNAIIIGRSRHPACSIFLAVRRSQAVLHNRERRARCA
jgi:hypothetical protein